MVTLQLALNCPARSHCIACRGNPKFRQSLVNAGLAPERDFPCPFGITETTASAALYNQTHWPAWARAIAAFSAPPDTGLGDTLARHFGIPGESFKSWFQSTFRKSCGCQARQAALNLQYPFQWKPAP